MRKRERGYERVCRIPAVLRKNKEVDLELNEVWLAQQVPKH